MKLTIDKLIAGLNCGAINARQLAVLGMKWPPRRGWMRNLIGKEISEDKYKRFLALRKQKRETTALELVPAPSLDAPLCAIYFDDGTSNNNPGKGGFGIGYGSYLLNDEVVRVNFARPMSCNEAEIRTLIAAAEAAKLIRDPARTKLCVYGDSRIALKWAQKAATQVFYRPSLGWTPGFSAAVADLYLSLKPFAEVIIHWHPREISVQIFGH
jgi:ribonuclease HI